MENENSRGEIMNSVVIVAAGSGRRMNLDINKQYIKLDEKEMIAHTIDVFYRDRKSVV